MENYVIEDLELNIPSYIKLNSSQDYMAAVVCFDGVGYTHYRGVYLQLDYPTVNEANASDDLRKQIGTYRFGDSDYFDKSGDSVCISDCAIAFGKVRQIRKQQYLETIDHLKEFLDGTTKICSECGELIHEGYVVNGGMEYFCSDKCLHKCYSIKDWNQMRCADGCAEECNNPDYNWDNDLGNEENYWTQWN